MGSNHSVQVVEESEDEEEEDHDERNINGETGRMESDNHLLKKVLEQEPEMLPCHASASPLSPQLSSLGTPRLGPSIKVWDPYNVLAPPPPLPPPPPAVFSRSFSANAMDDDQTVTEVFLISHGECELNLRPDLVCGRCPGAALTPNGKRQARALAVFLKSQGVRFSAVYSSPLDRAQSTAVSVCKEVNFSEELIQSSDALTEISQGNWEGCSRSEIYTPEILGIIDRFQPDFAAPSGESLRQVEFRMIHFLNGTIMGFPEKLRLDLPSNQNEGQAFAQHNSHALHHRPGLSRKTSGKSRLQFVTTTGDEIEDEISPSEVNQQTSLHNSSFSSYAAPVSCIGVFSHSVPIKCLLTGLLGCSPLMLHKICVDDSSVTVLQHSMKTGWQIKRLNDTAHLRLL
ncbi:2,3-bisphosphoglycerate-dependent phosphoglycerate mutase [Senna tora]|uniref:2,3-bisphosphoglycerate-dependent phosphoglycerate mutase n=1 Tax=Senna tora TaxID=362788 RepID=A0A834WE60_9FABA|nr:2,3-bisphosphoglycerate-dependent phosphoglycerate mutase [Senna tora]